MSATNSNGVDKVREEALRQNDENLEAWAKVAEYWDTTIAEGNDLFQELLLPIVDELAAVQPGERALDLATGNGIVARRLAGSGASVHATDACLPLLQKAKERTEATGMTVQYEQLDLMDINALETFCDQHHNEFALVSMSMAVKELASLDPIARALPKLLKPDGRIVIVNLHPCFSKPGTHRVVEIIENPKNGKQEVQTSIKVSQYLNIPPVASEAIRGQPFPLTLFHRPMYALLEPFFQVGLVLDAMREPSFQDGPDPKQPQSYHNFPQIPMLLAFRLRRR